MDIGRPYVVSRQVPDDRLAMLQKAFAAAIQDKAFLEVAKQRKMDVSLVEGEAAQDLVTKVLDAPRDVAVRAKEIIK
jgi:tripartite-type tricarboxylate transporter receptor subunit TctC